MKYLMLILMLIIFIYADMRLNKVEFVVGDLESITATFDEYSIQEYHIAKIVLNTFDYDEVIKLNVLSNYSDNHTAGTKVIVRIRNGYFTGYRYLEKVVY